LAFWGPESLVKAIGEVSRAMQDDRVDLIQRLLAMDLLAWILQADPAMRPQSVELIISHPFFEDSTDDIDPFVNAYDGSALVNVRVRLCRLTSEFGKQHNGKLGIVVAYERNESKFTVQIDPGSYSGVAQPEYKGGCNKQGLIKVDYQNLVRLYDPVTDEEWKCGHFHAAASIGDQARVSFMLKHGIGRGGHDEHFLPANVESMSMRATDLTDFRMDSSVIDSPRTEGSNLEGAKQIGKEIENDASGKRKVKSKCRFLNSREPLLGRSALQLAAVEGHTEVVELLLAQPGIDVDSVDHCGQTVVHTMLAALSDEGGFVSEAHEDALLDVLEAICAKADLNTVDQNGHTAFSLGLLSINDKVKHLMAQLQKDMRVLHNMKEMKSFTVDDFMFAWNSDRTSKKQLEAQLWDTCDKCLSRPNTKAKRLYLEENIYPLPIFEAEHRFEKLRALANRKNDEIIHETHRVRDRDIKSDSKGMELCTVRSFGKIRHPLPPDTREELLRLAHTDQCQQEVDEGVFVLLVRALATQATSVFQDKLMRALGEDSAVAGFAPENPPEDDSTLARKLVFLGPVKASKRMAVKVREYRLEAVEAERSTPSNDVFQEEAEEQARQAAKKQWPHIQNLGDSLRATVECASAADMFDAWKRVQAEFSIVDAGVDGRTESNGRLKNNLLTEKLKPPDMLINVVFEAEGYSMVAEIQIHLREIHRLKQERHLHYEIGRAQDIFAIRRSVLGPGEVNEDEARAGAAEELREQAAEPSDSDTHPATLRKIENMEREISRLRDQLADHELKAFDAEQEVMQSVRKLGASMSRILD